MRLFVYGTLRDDGLCDAVLGVVPSRQPARLHGYALHRSGDFLFVRVASGAFVDGDVIDVSPSALRRADIWEELPMYTRRAVCVRMRVAGALGEQRTQAWVYVRSTVVGQRVAAATPVCTSAAALAAALIEFRHEISDRGLD